MGGVVFRETVVQNDHPAARRASRRLASDFGPRALPRCSSGVHGGGQISRLPPDGRPTVARRTFSTSGLKQSCAGACARVRVRARPLWQDGDQNATCWAAHAVRQMRSPITSPIVLRFQVRLLRKLRAKCAGAACQRLQALTQQTCCSVARRRGSRLAQTTRFDHFRRPLQPSTSQNCYAQRGALSQPRLFSTLHTYCVSAARQGSRPVKATRFDRPGPVSIWVEKLFWKDSSRKTHVSTWSHR